MMHKACHSIEQVPFGFSRSSIKFPGYTVPKVNDLNPILSKNTRPVTAIKSLRFALFELRFIDTCHLKLVSLVVNHSRLMVQVEFWKVCQ